MKMNPLYVISIFCFYQSLHAAPAVAEIPQYFGKTLNTEELRGSFPLSGRELGKYIQNRGVDVVSLAPDESPEVSQEDIADWTKHLKKREALGRYFSQNSAGAEVDRPTIVVLSLTDKWTLIHEYMHHLYDKKRSELKALNEAQLFESQKNARADYLEMSSLLHGMKTLDLGIVQRTMLAFIDYMKFELQLVRQTAAEEIAIETTLSQLFVQNQIPDLYPNQYRIAQNYILNQRQRLSAQMETFFDIHNLLKNYSAAIETDSMAKNFADLQQFKHELTATQSP